MTLEQEILKVLECSCAMTCQCAHTARDLAERIERSWESVSEFSAEEPMKRWDQIVEGAIAAFVGGDTP